MSLTAPWLSPDLNETLLYSNPDPTDWLYLSPAYDPLASSALQEVSHRINVVREPASLQSPAYKRKAQRNHGVTPLSNRLEDSFTPSMSRILRGDSLARLPAPDYTPSPTLPLTEFPDISDICSQEPPSLFQPSPALFASSSFSGSQESYDLNASPLTALFYSGLRSTLGSFQSDVSPVVRYSQDQKPLEHPTGHRRTRRPPKVKEPSTFLDDLISAPRSALVDISAPPNLAASEFHSPLLSPCKLTSSQKNGRTEPPSVARSKQAPRSMPTKATAAPTLTLKLPFLHRSNAAPPTGRPLPSLPSSSLKRDIRSKRFREQDDCVAPPSKRHRDDAMAAGSAVAREPALAVASGSGPNSAQCSTQFKHGNRILPASVEISPLYPLFYRRFAVSSYFQPHHWSSPCTLFKVSHPGGAYNPPRSAFDLYTPRFVKGKGVDKVGLCPICVEPTARGGEGKKVWLAMKFSALNYHMQYYHGISASSGRPFSPPLVFRITPRKNPGKLERKEMREGKCHKCSKWVPVQGIKEVESKVPELYWWKHAAACHKQTTLPGERGVWEEDAIYKKLLEVEAEGSGARSS